jgi:predicted ABC-type transport system involved in lysophospholipase L1 biosynthesis ATPase subunit
VPLAEAQRRASKLLESVGLGKRADHRPDELSGGEMQRTALARALVTQPKLLLADEPTGNLDSKTGEEIFGLIRNLARVEGTAIVMVTHDPKAAARADRILTLRDGELESDERPAQTEAA